MVVSLAPTVVVTIATTATTMVMMIVMTKIWFRCDCGCRDDGGDDGDFENGSFDDGTSHTMGCPPW